MLHMISLLNSEVLNPNCFEYQESLMKFSPDATDNSRYNAVPFRVNNHQANAAEVYLGMPTSFNLGLKINF